MTCKPIYCGGMTAALKFAAQYLHQAGLPLQEQPRWDTGHLLLDVPSFRPGCDMAQLDTLLSSLPKDITVWGGNLDHASLDGYKKVDLLKDEEYLKDNAAITADCAIEAAAPLLTAPWAAVPTLIIGWGRIGKCLVQLLKKAGCPVTVATRSARDREKLAALGIPAVDIRDFRKILPGCTLVFNTVPAMVMPEEEAALCPRAVKIDLASKKGIAGTDVVWARGLPGKCAPERSGKLIADTVLRLMKEETL